MAEKLSEGELAWRTAMKRFDAASFRLRNATTELIELEREFDAARGALDDAETEMAAGRAALQSGGE